MLAGTVRGGGGGQGWAAMMGKQARGTWWLTTRGIDVAIPKEECADLGTRSHATKTLERFALSPFSVMDVLIVSIIADCYRKSGPYAS